MNTKKFLSIALVLVVGLFLANALPMVALADNPIPTISAISPNTLGVGSGQTNVTVTGTNFMQGSTVNVNGSSRPTTYVSPTQLTATLPASDFASTANFNISVTNPAPGGGTTSTLPFSVTSGNNPAPVISSMTPSTLLAGSGATTLTVNGSNFTNGSQIRFNGIALPTTFISANQISTALPATYLGTSGTYVVDVVNPAPGGGSSGTLAFMVSPTTGTPGLPNTGLPPQNAFAALTALAALVGAGVCTGLIAFISRKSTAK
jgi:hypothetical protein